MNSNQLAVELFITPPQMSSYSGNTHAQTTKFTRIRNHYVLRSYPMRALLVRGSVKCAAAAIRSSNNLV